MGWDPLIPALDTKRSVTNVERIDNSSHVRLVGVSMNGLGQSDCIVNEAQNATSGKNIRKGEASGNENESFKMVDLLTPRVKPVKHPLRRAAPCLVPILAIHDDNTKAAPSTQAVVIRSIGIYDDGRAILTSIRATPHR
jgi:hypothetical protein